MTGVGIHTGRIFSLDIKQNNYGKIRFVTKQASFFRDECEVTTEFPGRTSVRFGDIIIHTVEHLMFAIFHYSTSSVDICVTCDDNNSVYEIPTGDGSANSYSDCLAHVKRSKVKRFVLTDYVRVGNTINMSPLLSTDKTQIICEYVNSEKGIREYYNCDLEEERVRRSILFSRTFGFEEDFEKVKRMGMALGASKENVNVISSFGKYVRTGVLKDECAAHKIVDFVGDVFLHTGGFPVGAAITLFNSNHISNQKVSEILMETMDGKYN